MNIFRSFLMLGGIAAVAFLQSPMTQSNVEARGGALIAAQVPAQGPVAACNIAGYVTVSCAGISPGCTGGSFKAVVVNIGGDDNEDFRETGTFTIRGACTGNPDCKTPKSEDITSVGC